MPNLKVFFKFSIVGIIGTVAHYITLTLLVEYLTYDPVNSSAIGAIVGAVINYALNYHYTFTSANNHLAAFPKFSAIAMLGFIINIKIMQYMVESVHVHYLQSQILATFTVLLWNYFANTYWTFTERKR